MFFDFLYSIKHSTLIKIALARLHILTAGLRSRERFATASPFALATLMTPQVKRARRVLTSDQKQRQHDKQVGLTQALKEAYEEYAQRAKDIASKYGR
jgi:hypothetical protein